MTGAYMGGMRGIAMMQTTGFALIANALASLVVPYQIPAIIVISERGTIGEFNASAGRPHHAPDARCAGGFCITRSPMPDDPALRRRPSIKQACTTQSPVALILSPLLTGGNPGSYAPLNRRGTRHEPRQTIRPQTLNRADMTRRLVRQLAHDQAVIGGIGNANFDLYAVGHRAQNFYMLGSMGLACPIALGVALAQPHAA